MFHISLGSIANTAYIGVIQQYFERQRSVGHDRTQSLDSGAGCVHGPTDIGWTGLDIISPAAAVWRLQSGQLIALGTDTKPHMLFTA